MFVDSLNDELSNFQVAIIWDKTYLHNLMAF